MKAKYSQTITELNQELRLAQEEVRRSRNEQELSEHKLLEFKKKMTQSKDDSVLQVPMEKAIWGHWP